MIEATLFLEVLWVDPRAWLREAPENHSKSVRHFSPGWGIEYTNLTREEGSGASGGLELSVNATLDWG